MNLPTLRSSHFLSCSLLIASIFSLQSPFASAELTQVESADKLFGGFAIQFDKKSFAEALYNLKTFKVQTHASPDTQYPVYLDMGEVVTNAQVRSTILSGMIQAAKKLEFDYICSTPVTGRSWASLLAEKTGSNLLMIQKVPKYPGDAATIEGKFSPEKTCLLIDDVMFSGKTLMDSVNALKSVNLNVKDILVAVDREEGAEKRFQSIGIKTHSLAKMSELIDILQKEKKLIEKDQNMILNYKKKTKP